MALARARLARSPQIYLSRSSDPYVNLSIEYYLMQKSAPDSTVLFLYTNRPCVVIGRNQNPWIEANLALLRAEGVELVRRRSGGGAVYHDGGNANWSVTCPPAAFDRDRHAEMVVRALRGLGVAGTPRVNDRHDIVLDSDEATPGSPSTFKVSGSAYKLTRLRSLHHGTCLLGSPSVGRLGRFLRSPAEPFIAARGVESVRSPVRNVGVERAAFEAAVVAEFAKLYGQVDAEVVGEEEAAELPEIQKGIAELKSLEWTYQQTPQFTMSTHPLEDDPRERIIPDYLPKDFQASMTVRHGQITKADISGVNPSVTSSMQSLSSTYLHHITDWASIFHGQDSEPVTRWFNTLFGVGRS